MWISTKLTGRENYSLKTQFREKFIITKLSIISALDYLLSWLQISFVVDLLFHQVFLVNIEDVNQTFFVVGFIFCGVNATKQSKAWAKEIYVISFCV